MNSIELNRRLGLVGRGSGPTNGFYPAQPAEQGMPSVVRPNSNPLPMAQRSGPMDERFFHRPIDEGTPSIVRPVHEESQYPDVRFQTSPGNAYGQAYGPAHGLYRDGTPVTYPTIPETPEIYYPARTDRGQDVLLSRPTPNHPQEHSRQEVRRYRAADQPPLGRVELAPLEPIYRFVQVTPESATERPSSSSFGFVSHPETDA